MRRTVVRCASRQEDACKGTRRRMRDVFVCTSRSNPLFSHAPLRVRGRRFFAGTETFVSESGRDMASDDSGTYVQSPQAFANTPARTSVPT